MIRRPRRARAGGVAHRVVVGVVVGLVLAVLLGGCRVDAEVRVHAREDGSGWVRVTVTLDAEAVDRLGGDVTGALALDDLRGRGWRVSGARRARNGSVSVAATHDFARVDQVGGLIDQVDGPGGVLGPARLDRDVDPGRTTMEFSARVDPTRPLAAFGDEDLTAALDGEPLGRDLDELARTLGQPVDSLAGLALRVDLPGDVDADGDGAVTGGSATWRFGLGDEPAAVRASSTAWRWPTLALGATALVAVVAALVTGIRARRAA